MVWVSVLLAIVALAVAAVLSSRAKNARLAAEAEAERRRRERALEEEARALRESAAADAEATRRRLELEARTEVARLRAQAERDALRAGEEVADRAHEIERKEREVERRRTAVDERSAAVTAREQAIRDKDTAVRASRDEAKNLDIELRKKVEQLAGETGAEIKSRLVAEWIEEARGQAAERLRRMDASAADPEYIRTAKRVMGISVQRYHGHYLTERLLTNLPIVPGALPRIAGPAEENLRIIEEVSHVKLTPGETGESIRLEGQDSFGREIARRAISRFAKVGVKGAADARRICQNIAEELDREVIDLGRKAFKELEIPRSHPDIVKLVGKLNYRTSYTQNQWKHAIEASFLCGMMASELGLDVKLARRAALMHDIGKALTHEIDGSHAVIGADLARKLGESEIVANAIGAHHADEPFNSTYALLVAGADAMSGARPGARRQQDENYVERIEELERIARSNAGIERVYAVQGGREVRIYVQENRISDERAVELSSEIAHKISDELTFPGQIKVTVIREVRAISVAG